MAAADRIIRIYHELATHYDARREPQVRDRFLVLAADAATAAGRPEEAEGLRNRLLQLNPHHMLKPYSSWSQALQSQDVTSYIEGLRRTYPPSIAENLLASVSGSNDDDRAPQPLPSAAMEATLPYAPDFGTTAPVPSITKPATPAAKAKEAPAVIPFATVVPAVAAPVAKPAAPVANAISLRKAAPAARTWLSDSLSQRPERTRPSGAWLAVALYYLVLAASLALGAYTFIRPFYPLSGKTPEPANRELKVQSTDAK